MPPDLIASPLLLATAALGTTGAILLVAAIVAMARGKPLRFATRALAGIVLLLLAAMMGAVAFGMQGYQALTREEVAARMSVRPAGAQRFQATLRFPDGRMATYELLGDEIYVDAHILKWKPAANFIGLHTSYELDRVAGRYRGIEQERSAPRSVHSLARDRPVDLFGLRQRHAFLAPLLDAEYGSATFVPVTGPAELELRVSTTGLLIREPPPAAR